MVKITNPKTNRAEPIAIMGWAPDKRPLGWLDISIFPFDFLTINLP